MDKKKRMTRNLEDLMKTQVIDQNRTINHALHLHEELQTLRKENEQLISAVKELKAEREESNNIIESLETKLEELHSKQTTTKVSSNSSEERRLRSELHSLQVSLDENGFSCIVIILFLFILIQHVICNLPLHISTHENMQCRT